MTIIRHTITRLCEATPEVVSQIEGLVGHLTDTPQQPINKERLEAIVANPHTALFVAQEEGGAIVGMLTIAHLSLPTSEKLWIEDVVVSPAARGLGLGRRLVEVAAEWGRINHPTAIIYLTSNPARTAARALYCSLGFEEYNTGVFFLTNQ